mmetsp:Transcript_20660/g.40923  ORF Transcript_20660/g.40923 Transcript_20660/m.40923 type:complete len:1090 (-) Transcript_20660:25-3294(-)
MNHENFGGIVAREIGEESDDLIPDFCPYSLTNQQRKERRLRSELPFHLPSLILEQKAQTERKKRPPRRKKLPKRPDTAEELSQLPKLATLSAQHNALHIAHTEYVEGDNSLSFLPLWGLSENVSLLDLDGRVVYRGVTSFSDSHGSSKSKQFWYGLELEKPHGYKLPVIEFFRYCRPTKFTVLARPQDQENQVLFLNPSRQLLRLSSFLKEFGLETDPLKTIFVTQTSLQLLNPSVVLHREEKYDLETFLADIDFTSVDTSFDKAQKIYKKICSSISLKLDNSALRHRRHHRHHHHHHHHRHHKNKPPQCNNHEVVHKARATASDTTVAPAHNHSKSNSQVDSPKADSSISTGGSNPESVQENAGDKPSHQPKLSKHQAHKAHNSHSLREEDDDNQETLVDVLTSMQATSFGMAALFEACCVKTGIECISCHGISKLDTDLGFLETDSKHWWNLVWIEGGLGQNSTVSEQSCEPEAQTVSDPSATDEGKAGDENATDVFVTAPTEEGSSNTQQLDAEANGSDDAYPKQEADSAPDWTGWEWALVDCTCGAGFVSKHTLHSVSSFVPSFSNAFFNPVPQQFGLSHFPVTKARHSNDLIYAHNHPRNIRELLSQEDLQLVTDPENRKRFSKNAHVGRAYHEFALQVDTSRPCLQTIDSPFFSVDIESPNEELDFIVDLHDITKEHLLTEVKFEFEEFELSSCWYVETISESKSTIHVVFPYSGKFSVNIKARNATKLFSEHAHILEYDITTTQGVADTTDHKQDKNRSAMLAVGYFQKVHQYVHSPIPLSQFRIVGPHDGVFFKKQVYELVMEVPSSAYAVIVVMNDKWELMSPVETGDEKHCSELAHVLAEKGSRLLSIDIVFQDRFHDIVVLYRAVNNQWYACARFSHHHSTDEENAGAFAGSVIWDRHGRSFNHDLHYMPSSFQQRSGTLRFQMISVDSVDLMAFLCEGWHDHSKPHIATARITSEPLVDEKTFVVVEGKCVWTIEVDVPVPGNFTLVVLLAENSALQEGNSFHNNPEEEEDDEFAGMFAYHFATAYHFNVKEWRSRKKIKRARQKQLVRKMKAVTAADVLKNSHVGSGNSVEGNSDQ